MARRFDLLVFDWDGTVLDSTPTIVRALQAACRDLGLNVPSDAQANHVIGLGLAEALRYAAPDVTDAQLPELVDRYRHHYLSVDHEIRFFEGIPELLSGLHTAGYLLAVATGKSRKGLDRAFAGTGLGHYFVASRCADECFSKPHPQMLEELMAELEIGPERTLMIGDTTHDLQMAVNAGVACVGVTYGAHPEAHLAALMPLACVQDVQALSQWIAKNA